MYNESLPSQKQEIQNSEPEILTANQKIFECSLTASGLIPLAANSNKFKRNFLIEQLEIRLKKNGSSNKDISQNVSLMSFQEIENLQQSNQNVNNEKILN